MPALVRSKPDVVPKAETALGKAVREILESQQAGLLESMRAEVLGKLEELLARIGAPAELLAAAKAIEGQPGVMSAALGAAAEKIEKVVTAAMDERMSDVVGSLVELRRELKASQKPRTWIATPTRKGKLIENIEFKEKT